jgi:hypothetical protein
MMWLVQSHGEARIKQWCCDQVLAMKSWMKVQSQSMELKAKVYDRVFYFASKTP